MVRAPLFNRFDQSFSYVCESFFHLFLHYLSPVPHFFLTCCASFTHAHKVSFIVKRHWFHHDETLVSSWWDTSFITMRLIKDIDEKDTRRMGKGLEDREKECGSLLDKECKQVILLSKEYFKKSPPASYCLLRWVDISPKQCKEIGIDVLVRKPHPSSPEGRSA